MLDQRNDVPLDHSWDPLVVDSQDQIPGVQLALLVVDEILTQLPNEGEQAKLSPSFHIEAKVSFFVAIYKGFFVFNTPMFTFQRFLFLQGLGHGFSLRRCRVGVCEV